MPKKYKVVTFGGMDGVKFPDLLVKYSSGYVLPLHVKEGQYVPLEILDPLDVKKSLIVGSLGRYIESGAVIVEDDEEEVKEEVVKPIVVKEVVKKEVVEKVVQEPIVEKTETQQTQAELEKFLTNLSDVKVVDDFFKLSYFQKLKFIKECSDKILLQSIMSKVPPDGKQLLNNLQLKLSQM